MGRPAIAVCVQREFWKAVRGGLSAADAGVAVGVGRRTAQGWFVRAGGVIPSIVDDPGRSRLCLAEREEIACLRSANLGVRAIARQLGRSPSTISRELRRRRAGRGGYRASIAQAEADRLARRPKQAKLATNLVLRREVQDRLKQNHSPEQIAAAAAGLPRRSGDVGVPRDDLPVDLRAGPRRAEAESWPRTCAPAGRCVNRADARPASGGAGSRAWSTISERPAEVEDRAVPGHWEGDLIIGSTASDVRDRDPGRARHRVRDAAAPAAATHRPRRRRRDDRQDGQPARAAAPDP